MNPGADAAKASEQLQQYLSLYYGPGYPMENTAFGPPIDIARKVRSFGDAGCGLVIMGLPGPDLAKLEILASEVAPILRGG